MIFDMSIDNLQSLFDPRFGEVDSRTIKLSEECSLVMMRLWAYNSLEKDAITVALHDSSYDPKYQIGTIVIERNERPTFYLYGWRTRDALTSVHRAEFIDFVMFLDKKFSDLILWNGL